MKLKFKSFTLVESVIVLSLVALLLGLGLALRPKQNQQSFADFQQQFAAHFQRARLLAQAKGVESILDFQSNQLVIGQAVLSYPVKSKVERATKVVIKPSGYVAPGHITWHQGQGTWRLIFQFGGGTYRFEKV
ncbi:hypothetical protein [Fructobacillus evanidus]|uniref:Competence protein ComGD n=1 Tax=Fructobacillus evanidus TaxID=3064281 RepID=A0ABM9MPT0_9LACO|nr:hypothetical protein R53718_MFFEMHAI_00434 [Fructobacillus sp. LMG 32999]CAK1231615.1 hypothetical protein R55214_HHFBAMCI_00384 [Fructobacillus sp. LMG 32999]CAK1232979.1 hypothetical protein R55203_MFJFHIJN_00443 [Fructobacillus sp. LMG 32999]CAK1235614.1 hypothetical protein R54837_OMAIDLJD_00569 [Fructobacillus sp. LMG 32999]CAK1238881.1 hypothetical protein R55250_KEHBDPNM_01133 [Fructobacillus sp. LMG 32999]